MRPVLDDEEVTRVESPTARQKEEALSAQVTRPRLPAGAEEPATPEDEEPTVRQRPRRLPRDARMTLPSRHDIDRRALPFAKPQGRRGEDEPLELAETVKAPSSVSLDLEVPVDSPWSQHAEIDRDALPSSMAPPPFVEPADEEGIERARRATLILWVAVAAVAVITLAAMLWT